MSDNTYVVVKGDDLFTIAKKYGIPPRRLIQLNPALRKHPDLIHPDMEIRISDKTDAADALKISRMLFDGKRLTIYSMHRDHILARYPAISGLRPNSRHLSELIKSGRKDLKIDTDYRQLKYQHVKDAGPIPTGILLLYDFFIEEARVTV